MSIANTTVVVVQL